MLLAVILLSGCGGNTDINGSMDITEPVGAETEITEDKQRSRSMDAENQPAENGSLPDEKITDLWKQKAGERDWNVLEFVTGLQIILPKEWEDKIVIFTEPAVQSNGGALLVCEKSNAEAGAGGTLFLMEYFMHEEDTAAPYEIFGMDRLLGVYQNGEDEYALVLELPREMNYVEGNEEMKKVYEDVYAFVDKLQIVTDRMKGFRECGVDELYWMERY